MDNTAAPATGPRGVPDFQDIYEAFHDKVRRYVSRLAGESEAEDLTQEVFVKVSRGLPGFRGDSQLSTWIYRIATNRAMDKLRPSSLIHDAQDIPLEAAEEEQADRDPWSGEEAPLLDQQLIRKDMNACIRGIVDDLPENYRSVIVLSELEGLRNQEIAEVLELSLDTVKIRLHRARARLKENLEAHCSFYRDERNILCCDRKSTRIPLKAMKH